MSAKQIPIVDIVRHYSGVELKQKGREYFGLCPFHAEKTPSFSVSPAKNVWHCYGCGIGGSPIDYVMKLKGINFKSACLQIEADFNIRRDGGWQQPAKTSEAIRANSETEINDYIHKVFCFCWNASKYIGKELQTNYSNPDIVDENCLAILLADRDLFDRITKDIASAEPELVVLAVKKYNKRWRKDGESCGGNTRDGI